MRRGRRDFWLAARRRERGGVIQRRTIVGNNRVVRGREQADAQQAAAVEGTVKGGRLSASIFREMADDLAHPRILPSPNEARGNRKLIFRRMLNARDDCGYDRARRVGARPPGRRASFLNPGHGKRPMILVIDNYDSFTFNLVQRLGEIDPSLAIEVHRNDKITVDEIAARRPTHLIISPGPCTPNEAGISVTCVQRLAGRLPILGVCLGHQSIGQATGGTIVRARQLMHGKTDSIHHDDRGLFAGLPNPFTATRYHSLVIQPDTLSDAFEVSAWADAPGGEREIMGVRHKQFPLEGWQFHPESFLTECGHELLRRFLQLSV